VEKEPPTLFRVQSTAFASHVPSIMLYDNFAVCDARAIFKFSFNCPEQVDSFSYFINIVQHMLLYIQCVLLYLPRLYP
jgi:hypothetical protein